MKTTRTVLILLSVIIVLPIIGYFLWIIQKDRILDLMIINKTVLTENSNEVKSLNYVLNYKKILKSTENTYDYNRDYFGFFPQPVYEGEYIKSFKMEDVESISDQYDGLIYLDNEGVVSNRLGKGLASRYGGFNQNDYILLKEMYNKNKLIIAENNFFSEPTEDLVRFNTEQLLDVYSLHWTGKLFKNLEKKKISQEIKEEWFEIYKNQYNSEWNYEGSGMVLFNKRQSRILVLPASEYMQSEFPSINTDPDLASFYNLPEEIPFGGWFQLVYEGKNQVISHFDLNLNEKGIELLKNSGLEAEFPASIALNEGHHYFFAGDFSKQNVFLACSKNRFLSGSLNGICKLMSGNPGQFFQNYYVPLMSTVFDNYLNSKEEKKTEEI